MKTASLRFGFTLIELMVTLAIMALLASVAVPLTQLAAQRNKEEGLRMAVREIRSAIDAYKAASDAGNIPKDISASGYPPTLESLAEGVKDSKSPSGQMMYFLRRIPRDPTCDCPDTSDADTWELRSYASPPDSPSAGDDVFDVYSRSTGKGLNGVPYSEW